MTTFPLGEKDLPTAWFNLLPRMPEPLQPPLHPATHEPVGPDDLAPLFPMALIGQEVSSERYIEIPEPVQEVYRLWRPSPLYRAHRLEKALGTPARIYYKYEGVSPAGSHKPNTAVPQAYYNALEGARRLTTETGAGQWGSALAFACSQFDLEREGALEPLAGDRVGSRDPRRGPGQHRQPRHRDQRGRGDGRPGRGHALR